MSEVSQNGLMLRWSEAVANATGAGQRVLVEAGPASPANVLRLIYSIGDGPERAVRGWPVGADPETGLQAFAAHLPDVPKGQQMNWRPVLSQGRHELDPKRAGAPESVVTDVTHAPLNIVKPDKLTPALAAQNEDTSQPLFAVNWEYIFRVFAPFENDIHSLGETPDGVRMRFQLKPGGLVRGPAMNGEILSTGGDWMRIRRDGIGVADVHALIRTDTGGLLLTEYTGICDFGPDGYKSLCAGHLPETAPVRLAPRYLTSDPAWSWLNRIQGFAVGVAHLNDLMLQYDEYVVRTEPGGGDD